MSDIFKLAKTVPLKSYMVLRGVEFKNSSHSSLAFCPFHNHDHQTPSLGVRSRDGEEFFNCFSCATAGDIITFVEKLDGLTPLNAARKICEENDIPYEGGRYDELTQEEQDAIDRKNKEQQLEEYQKRRSRVLEAEEKARVKARQEVAVEAPILANQFAELYDSICKTVTAIFPNQSMTFTDWQDTYLGWDVEHDSLVIINREKNDYFSTKHHQKYIWDKKAKTLIDQRVAGKWLMNYQGTVYPFPMEYFKQHTSDRVIITEGEKDALNLLSYQVNCLTLGGVTNSWEAYASSLRDKIVYIWFDHDNAGYKNAIKQYLILKGFVKDIFIVTFYSLGGGLEKGFDISDWLAIKSGEIQNADDIYDKIAYSSSKLTNELIEEISEVIDEELEQFKAVTTDYDFKAIREAWSRVDSQGLPVNIVKVKGELDADAVEDLIIKLDAIKRSDGYGMMKNQIAYALSAMNGRSIEVSEKEAENTLTTISKVMELKKSLLNNHRQTHIVDMVDAFNKMTSKSGFTLGEYRGRSAVWSGTHYIVIEDIDMSKFIHNTWMQLAWVDFKKQTKSNVDQVIENLKSKAVNLSEIKQRQTRRISTLLNGTVLVSSGGKVTFKPSHDKSDASTNLLKFDYDSTARCPKWEKFLHRVLPDDNDRRTLMEFFGYCILPNHDYEAFLFLYGKSGANGKSVILDVMRSFFGPESVSALQLQQFQGHELHALDNKILNIGSEIDPRGLDKGQLST